MSDEQLIVTIGAKDSASSAIKKVNQELKYLDKEYALAKKSSNDFETSQEGLQKKLDTLNSKYEANNAKLNAYKKQLDLAKESVSKKKDELDKLKASEEDNAKAIEKAEKQLDRYQQQMISATRNINLTEAEMKNLTNEINSTSNALDNFKSDQLKTKIDKIAKSAEETGDKFKNAGEKITGIGGGITKVAGVALAGSAALGMMAIDTESSFDRLQGRLGLTAEETEKLRKVALSVYENGFGGSIDDSIDGLVSLQQNLESTKTWSDDTKQATLEQIMTINSLFGTETGELTKTLAVMQNSGLTDDINTALDVITVGFQKGGDSSGELLDTLREYSPQFVKLGLSADEAMNFLITGANNGAFTLDKVGDALKEFSIRAIDGSKATSEGFKSIGLNADEMAKKFAAGGEGAKGAFSQVVKAISNVNDPLKQSQAGVNLFGTMWEDLGPQAILSLATVQGGIEGVDDATKKAGEAINNNFSSQFQSSLRKVKDDLLPLGIDVMELAKENIPTLTDAVREVTKFLGSMDDGTKKNIAKIVLFSAVLGPAVSGIGALTSGVGSLITVGGKGYSKIAGLVSSVEKIDNASKAASVGGIGKLAPLMGALAPVAVGVGAGFVVAAGAIELAKAHTDLYNSSVTKSKEEMSGLEIAIAKVTGATIYSKDELQGMGAIYSEWNSSVSPETQSELEKMAGKFRGLQHDMDLINLDGVVNQDEVSRLVSRTEEMCSTIIKAIEDHKNPAYQAMYDLFMQDGAVDDAERIMLDSVTQGAQKQIEEIKKGEEKIQSIYQNAVNNHKQITEEEQKEISQIESSWQNIILENLTVSQEEYEAAISGFNERIVAYNTEGLSEIVKAETASHDESIQALRDKYDSAIKIAKEGLPKLEGQARIEAEARLKQYEEAYATELENENKLYDGKIELCNTKYPELMEQINQYNGEVFKQGEEDSTKLLEQMKTRFDNLGEITKTGNYIMYDNTVQSLKNIAVTVDEKTGEVTGIYDTFTGEVGAYTNTIVSDVKGIGDQQTATSSQMKNALNDMASNTINSAGQIVNKNGEIVGSLDNFKEATDHTRSGVLNLNGTPIAIQTNADQTIANVQEVTDKIHNIPGSKNVTIWTTIKGAFEAVGDWLGFAEGTNNAPRGVAFVAEEGQELILDGNRALLTGSSGAQLYNFSGGETVYTADETKKILANRQVSGGYFSPDSFESSQLVSNVNNSYSNTTNNGADMTSLISNMENRITNAIIQGMSGVQLKGNVVLNDDVVAGRVGNNFAMSRKRVR